VGAVSVVGMLSWFRRVFQWLKSPSTNHGGEIDAMKQLDAAYRRRKKLKKPDA